MHMLIAVLLSLLPSALPMAASQEPAPVTVAEPDLRWDGETEDAYRRALHLWAVRGKPGEAADILIPLADTAEVTQIAGQASWVLVLAAQALAEAGRADEATALIPGIERGARGTPLEVVVIPEIAKLKQTLGGEQQLDEVFFNYLSQMLRNGDPNYARIAQYGSQAIPYLLNLMFNSHQAVQRQALMALVECMQPKDVAVVLGTLRSRRAEEVQILLSSQWPLPKASEPITAVGSLLVALSRDRDLRVAQEAARLLSGWLSEPVHSIQVVTRAREIARDGPELVLNAMMERCPIGAARGAWQEILDDAASGKWPQARGRARWYLATMPNGAERALSYLKEDGTVGAVRYCFALGVTRTQWNQPDTIRSRVIVLFTGINAPEGVSYTTHSRVTNWELHQPVLMNLIQDENSDVRFAATLAAWQNRESVPEALALAIQQCRQEAWFPDLLAHWRSSIRNRESGVQFDELSEALWSLVQLKSDLSVDAAAILFAERGQALSYERVHVLHTLGVSVSWKDRVQNWYQSPVDVESLRAVCLNVDLEDTDRVSAGVALVSREPGAFIDVLRRSNELSVNDRAPMVKLIPNLLQKWSPRDPDSLSYSADDLLLCLELLESSNDIRPGLTDPTQVLASLFGSRDPEAFDAFRRYATTPDRARRLLELPKVGDVSKHNSGLLIQHWLGLGWPAVTWLQNEQETLLDDWIEVNDASTLEIARMLSSYHDLPFQYLLLNLFSNPDVAWELRDVAKSWLLHPRLAHRAIPYFADLYRDPVWPQLALDVLALPDLKPEEQSPVIRLMSLRPDPAFVPHFLKWLEEGKYGDYPEKGLLKLKALEEQRAFWESWQATGVGGSPTAALLKQIQSKNKEVRLSAIRALGATKAPEALPLLISLLEDPDPEVVAAARAGLAWLNPESAPK